jgi:hypothetical protein
MVAVVMPAIMSREVVRQLRTWVNERRKGFHLIGNGS